MISRRGFVRNLGLGTAGISVAWPLAVKAAIGAAGNSASDHQSILLNQNENAYGPSRRVRAAMYTALANAQRFPYEDSGPLIERIAALHKVRPEQVLLGAGSTEILRLASAAFLGPGKQLVQAAPTHSALASYAQAFGTPVASVPLTAEYAHDLDRMLAHCNESPSLVYICNPNNPTASLTPRRDLDAFLSKLPKSCCVVIDEAYHHYAGKSAYYQSFLDPPLEDSRVIVTRTFSKVYGLAGLRIGYGISTAETAAKLGPFSTPTGINKLALIASVVALDDTQGTEEAIRRNADDRQEFFNQAIARMLRPVDSNANFVMINTHHPADEVVRHFEQNSVHIAPPFPPLNTYIRVSLGTPPEMRAFWRAWDLLPFAKSPMHH